MLKKGSVSILILALVLALSIVSTQAGVVQTQELAQADEAQTVGGSKCATAWGLGIGLAIGALSPCGVLCATLAWYDLLAIGATCGW